MKEGSCLCGAVRFTMSDDLKAPDACHCIQCRKFSGHYAVGTDVASSAVEITGIEHVNRHASSQRQATGGDRGAEILIFRVRTNREPSRKPDA